MTTPAGAQAVLGPDDVHVWFVRSDGLNDPARLDACEALLSPDEKARAHRFVHARDRHEFVVAHALVRTTLSRYADVPPRAWTFRATGHGRPEVDGPPATARLRFNLSHTRGLSACAVALDRHVGVDVEACGRRAAAERIAARYFAPAEIAAIRAAPAADRVERFIEYWTLKEAYIKARGGGLSIPLSRFAFHLAPGRSPAVTMDASLGDDPAAWQFAQFRLEGRHLLAVAVRRRDGHRAAIAWREAERLTR